MSNDLAAGRGQMMSTLGGAYLGANPVNGYLSGFASGNLPTEGIDTYRSLLQNTPTGGQEAFALAGQQVAQPTTGMMMLGQQAAGGENPYLDATYNRAANQVKSQLAGQFAGAGRYGSGSQAAAMGDAAGNLANQMYGAAYESDANRRLQAAQGLTSAQNTANSNILQAASGYSTAEQQAQANRLAAAGGMQGGIQSNVGSQIQSANIIGNAWDNERNRQIQAMMFSPQMAQAEVLPAQAMAEVGGTTDAYNQDLINANIQRYNYGANQDYNALQKYMGLIQGNYGGTTTTSTQNAGGSKIGGILGGGMSGAGLGQMIGAGTSLGAPWGAALGAGAGGLVGLLGGR
jgi:hypothetical protein